jgi:hypothetical protein
VRLGLDSYSEFILLIAENLKHLRTFSNWKREQFVPRITAHHDCPNQPFSIQRLAGLSANVRWLCYISGVGYAKSQVRNSQAEKQSLSPIINAFCVQNQWKNEKGMSGRIAWAVIFKA